jgi:hypothetical protein
LTKHSVVQPQPQDARSQQLREYRDEVLGYLSEQRTNLALAFALGEKLFGELTALFGIDVFGLAHSGRLACGSGGEAGSAPSVPRISAAWRSTHLDLVQKFPPLSKSTGCG